MKKVLVLVSLLLVASFSIARAESLNISADQVSKQDCFLLAQNNNRDTSLTDLLVDRFNPPIAAHCGSACETSSHCDSDRYCKHCINGKCSH